MRKLSFYLLFFLSVFSQAQEFTNIKFFTEKEKNSYQIFAENQEIVPMSASFTFTLKNMTCTLKNDKMILIPAKSKKFYIATVTANDQTHAYNFKYQFRYNFGDVTQTKYDENYSYDLPFEQNKTYTIYQGYNGKISHQNQFALDFSLKEGDKVFTAREGKVFEVIENNDSRCPTAECSKFNNKIMILQPDGTFAEYLHLKINGAEVSVGDEVSKGQFIGYSGNTGWSTGPHLHFAVFLNKMGGKREYIKTKFKTANSSGEYLEEKKSYLKNY